MDLLVSDSRSGAAAQAKASSANRTTRSIKDVKTDIVKVRLDMVVVKEREA